MRPISSAVLLALLFCSTSVLAQQSVRNPKTEQVIYNKLAAISPAAVEPFRHATAAMDAGNYQDAIPLYQQVLQQAPSFTPAMRRLGACLAETGHRDDGIALSEKAVQFDRSPENLASLAQVLAFPRSNERASESDLQSAFSLAKEASEQYTGDDASYLTLEAQLALLAQNEAGFRQATETLVHTHPELMTSHYFNAVRLAIGEDWVASEDEIKTAGRMGLPQQAVDAFLSSGVRRHAIISRCLHYAPYFAGAWIVGLLLLFVAGKIFSALTLRLIESDPASSISGTEMFVRSCYRHLINVAGSFYYVSLPFVIVLVLGLAGGIIYLFLMIGSVPIKLALLLVVGAVVTIYKMVQTLFVRVAPSQPGRALRREEAPDVWNVTREVADKLGTRPLDQIRITPGTEMAVYETGTRRERRQDKGYRTLVMGIGLMPGFKQNAFRAILAHEYGHLSHRDTAGGDVALRVNQDMMKFAFAMAVAGQAVPWNVAFQFLRLYHFLFRRISYGATRLQEVLADRAAARLYGAEAFEEGLRHVVRRQVEFRYVALNEIKTSRQAGTAFRNVYTLHVYGERDVDNAINKALHQKTSEDDTHPSPIDRFRLVSRVHCDTPEPARGVMWDLFPNLETLTAEMTSQIESEVKG